MKLFLCLMALLAVTLAAPQQYNRQQYRPQSSQQQYNQPKAQQYRPAVQPTQYAQPKQYTQQQSAQNVVPIVAYSNEVSPDGSYSYSYQAGDGSTAQESGYVKQVGTEQAQTVQGSYSYTAPDGTPITVNYVADENGFRAEGAHLPTPPPIPAAIQRSLDYIASTQGRQPQQQQNRQQQYNQQQYKQRF